MKIFELLEQIAECPSCHGPLNYSSNQLNCSQCKLHFPTSSEIPWLYPDPLMAKADWQNRFEYYLQVNRIDIEKIKAELQASHLMPQTIQRLKQKIQALTEHSKEVQRILQPLKLNDQGDPAIHRAAGTQLPENQTLMSYHDNVFRDWSYGEDENRLCLEEIKHVLTDPEYRKLGNLGVLGSGACRLAYDIHQALECDHTINIDINPLLLAIAQRMTKGKPVNLWEFPRTPKSLKSTCVKLKCKAPEVSKPGFSFMFADAMNPPFKQHAFDTLLTPWIIDIVYQDLTNQFRRFNHILKMGGQWINFGTLAFFHARQELCYSVEETLAIAESCGFKITSYRHEEVPYLQSPHSCQKRVERVLCFRAEKVSEVEKPQEAFSMEPDWLKDASKPIPATPDFKQNVSIHNVLTQIYSLIDGKSSLEDLGKKATFLGLTAEQAQVIIRNTLGQAYRAHIRGRQI